MLRCKYTIVYCHGTGEDLARGFWWLDYLVHTTGVRPTDGHKLLRQRWAHNVRDALVV